MHGTRRRSASKEFAFTTFAIAMHLIGCDSASLSKPFNSDWDTRTAPITLNTYAHMLPGDDEEAAELIDKRLRGYKEAVGKWTE